MRNHIITHHPPGPGSCAGPARVKRSVGAFVVAAALLATTAGPAHADPGDPGSTFPEQPGTKLQSGCNAILTNPNNAFEHRADPAEKITTGLTIDACVPGA